MLKSNMIKITLIIFSIFFTKISYANNFTPFMKLFSSICVSSTMDFNSIKFLAKENKWKELSENQKKLYGLPVSGAPLDGWAFKQKGVDGVFLLGLVHSKKDKMKNCTLFHNASNYKENIKLLRSEFEVKKIDELKQGIQYMETFKVRHFLFDKAYIIAQQDKRETKNDLLMFSFAVDLK